MGTEIRDMSHAQQERRTVLMIEDEETTSDLVTFILERSDYTVFRMADGRQAQQAIDVLPPPDLVLLDIMLPFNSGLELLTYIKEKPGWRSVPVIMLTADASEGDVKCALGTGACDYILKPFKPSELLARVQLHIKKTT